MLCTQAHAFRHQVMQRGLTNNDNDGREQASGLTCWTCLRKHPAPWGLVRPWEGQDQRRATPHPPWPTCMTNSLRRGRPRSVRSMYSGSFSFFACWIWASLLIGFITWPYSGPPCTWGTINIEKAVCHVSHKKDLINSEIRTWQEFLLYWFNGSELIWSF